MLQVSSRRHGINLQSCNCNELLSSRLPSEPRGVSSITARQSWGQPGHQCPCAHFNGTSRPQGFPVPTEMTNTVTKRKARPNTLRAAGAGTAARQQREGDQNLKRILCLQHAGLPGERDSWAVRALTSPCGLSVVPRSYRQISTGSGWESNKKKLRPSIQTFWQGIGVSLPTLYLVWYLHKLNITSFSVI